MVCLYLNLDHVKLAFSLPLDHMRSSNSLHHPAHSRINISHVSLLSHTNLDYNIY
jgi:hypothetical protein